ncbi:MAG: TetR/AcrR family transcriptional regulator [candidate division Zixibacteria bacterium]|nr:TetR/AcrR family transcriptional regulator [candidate division Zixibacteria bacterium]MBU1470821.1 TetR/AcrR family transcriptional regulator [candidate division Zixibacteria bacterium]MBU2625759.1 TetR/AcrR family transcriptional regulator [candidate division Zixibacteria bacterium]
MSTTSKRDAANIQMRTRIIEASREKFFRFGFSAITTDEIATDLGISKKTLYRHFSSKDELLHQAVFDLLADTAFQLRGILHDDETDFVEKLKMSVSLMVKTLSRFHSPFVRDVQRSSPETYTKILKFRRTKILSQFSALFQSGIETGLLRKDMDINLLMVIFTQLIDGVVNPEVVSQLPYSTHEVFEGVMNTFLIGILSDKSRAQYQT